MTDTTTSRPLQATSDHIIIRHPDGKTDKPPLPKSFGIILTIGRELDNNIVCDDPRVSRYHAKLRRSENGVELSDVGSANGTYVGKQKVEPGQWLIVEPRQEMRLGETILTWEADPLTTSTIAAIRREENLEKEPGIRLWKGWLIWAIVLIFICTLMAIAAVVLLHPLAAA